MEVWDKLPNDVLGFTFSWLDPHSLSCIEQSSKSMKSRMQKSYVWLMAAQRMFTIPCEMMISCKRMVLRRFSNYDQHSFPFILGYSSSTERAGPARTAFCLLLISST